MIDEEINAFLYHRVELLSVRQLITSFPDLFPVLSDHSTTVVVVFHIVQNNYFTIRALYLGLVRLYCLTTLFTIL
jgi:hypothetical protein